MIDEQRQKELDAMTQDELRAWLREYIRESCVDISSMLTTLMGYAIRLDDGETLTQLSNANVAAFGVSVRLECGHEDDCDVCQERAKA